MLSVVQQREAQVIECLGIVRPEPQGGTAAVDRLVVLAQCPPDLGEVGVVDGGGRAEGDGAADQLGGLRMPAQLIEGQSQQMQRLGVVGVARQYDLVEPRGVVELSALVLAEGRLQWIVHHQ